MKSNHLFRFVAAILFLPAVLHADVFLLKDGGKIDGELINPQEIPRKTYKILCGDGLEIDIEPKFVERIRKGRREAMLEYDAFAPLKEDTLENHLEIAQWCRDNQLQDLSDRHLQQALEHDPDNAEARRLLGHFKAEDGSWTNRQEMLGSRGIIRDSDGGWKTQQQIDVEQILNRKKKAEVEWDKEVDSLRAALPNSNQARNRIMAINDPAATGALRKALVSERNEDTRTLLVRALSNIATSPALHEIARWAVSASEPVWEVRRVCFDELRKHPEALPAIIGFYTSNLSPENDPAAINRTATALAELEARSAIPQLIDMLVVTQTQKVNVKAAGPVFNNNGTALGWGQSTVNVTRNIENPRVLDALVRLTGVNYQYNKDAWRHWLIQSRQTPSFNARRG